MLATLAVAEVSKWAKFMMSRFLLINYIIQLK